MIFKRDRFTWLAYFLMAYYAYLEGSLGPLMPFLRDELHLSYTVTGLHLSAMAVGTMLGGLFGDRIIQRIGRRRAFWIGGGGMGAGMIVLTLGDRALITISGTWLMGFLGFFLINTIQAGLSDHHGSARTIAFTEANIMSSVVASQSPLLIGGLQSAGIGWRGALYLIVTLWALVALRFGGVPIPDEPRPAGRDPATGALPGFFWLCWLIVVLVVAVERCMAFWGAAFLQNAAGLSKVNAAGSMWLLFIAMLAGRLVVSRLARRMHSGALLLASILIALAGFPLFWLAESGLLAVTGLFITGLGVANFFPLSTAIAVSAAAEQANQASARALLASGTATLIAPQALGWAADGAGMRAAFGMVGVILVLALAVTGLAKRLALRHNYGSL